MHRVDITWSLLQLKALGIKDIVHFDYISPPSVASVLYSMELLFCLGAIDENSNLTDIGRKLAEMPGIVCTCYNNNIILVDIIYYYYFVSIFQLSLFYLLAFLVSYKDKHLSPFLVDLLPESKKTS